MKMYDGNTYKKTPEGYEQKQEYDVSATDISSCMQTFFGSTFLCFLLLTHKQKLHLLLKHTEQCFENTVQCHMNTNKL